MDGAKLCRFESSETLRLCILDFSDRPNTKLAMEDAMPMEEVGKLLFCRILFADVSFVFLGIWSFVARVIKYHLQRWQVLPERGDENASDCAASETEQVEGASSYVEGYGGYDSVEVL